MQNITWLVQIAISLSVAFVWIFRYENVMNEFKQFGLSNLTRNFVGASKIATSTVLVAGIWYPELVQGSAIVMGFFMVAAQFFHFKIHNPFIKHLPSLILLVLCAFLVFSSR